MADPGGMILSLYAALTGVAAPAGRLVLAARLRRHKEDPARWRERLGRSELPRPAGPVVWVHAVSVGETVAALPFVDRLIAAGFSAVVTTVTTTSAALAEFRAGPASIHQYAPLDLRPAVDRFLDHWQPQLAVFIESELWPVTISRLDARGIPLVISNGRMSERSGRRWSRFPAIARAVFSRLSLVLAQSEGDGARYRALGAGDVITVGNVKFDADVPEAPAETLASLRTAIGGRPVILAASTHPGEEEMVLSAFGGIRRRLPHALIIIAPRHPDRGAIIAEMAAPLNTVRRSEGRLPGADTDVYVADTLGELGTLYRLADVALIGGSLVPGIGGHNPIEPARLGTAALTGPHFDNWTDVFSAFIATGGIGVVRSPTEIAAAVTGLFDDPACRAAQIAAAGSVAAAHAGALERTMAAIAPLLAAARRRAP